MHLKTIHDFHLIVLWARFSQNQKVINLVVMDREVTLGCNLLATNQKLCTIVQLLAEFIGKIVHNYNKANGHLTMHLITFLCTSNYQQVKLY